MSYARLTSQSRLAQIAIFLPDLRGGGAERLHVLLAEEFLRRGYGVEFVLLRAQGDLLEGLPAGVKVVDLRARRIRDGLSPLIRYLRSQQPGAMLAALWPLTGIAALARALSGWKGGLVLSEHTRLSRSAAVKGMSDVVNRRLGRLIYGAADAVVAVSHGVKDDLLARTGLPSALVHVIHNPVRRPDPSVTGDPALLAWWKGAKTAIIAVGALKPAKDYPTLLRAFAGLAGPCEARLLILGEGPDRFRLETLVSDLGLADKVRLPGAVPDPYPYLGEADLFVLSSAWEGFGNVIVEALAVGTPVVATDCESGPAEILESDRYGRLAPVGDPRALADAIRAALAQPPDGERLKARARDFSLVDAADRYLALLEGGR